MKSIRLTRGFEAIVDDADFELLKHWRWCAEIRKSRVAAKRGFRADGAQFQIYMHRQIMRAAPGMQVDHINGDALDNRRANLRIVTAAQNKWNSKLVRSASGFRGVVRRSDCAMWQAQIKHCGCYRYLGLFRSPEEAARAYDQAALELRGEFAHPNFG